MNHIVGIFVQAGALGIIDRKRAEAEIGIDGETLEIEKMPVVGRKRLPGELAADIETADIAAKSNFPTGRKLMADARPEERIGPIDQP